MSYSVRCVLRFLGVADETLSVHGVSATSAGAAMAAVQGQLRSELFLLQEIAVVSALLDTPLPLAADGADAGGPWWVAANGWVNVPFTEYCRAVRQAIERVCLTRFQDQTGHAGRLQVYLDSFAGMPGTSVLEGSDLLARLIPREELDLALEADALRSQLLRRQIGGEDVTRGYLEALRDSPTGVSPWPFPPAPDGADRGVLTWQCPVCACPVSAEWARPSVQDDLLARHLATGEPLYCRFTICRLGKLTHSARATVRAKYGGGGGRQAIVFSAGVSAVADGLPVALAVRGWEEEQRARPTLRTRAPLALYRVPWMPPPMREGQHPFVYHEQVAGVERAALTATALQLRCMDVVRLALGLLPPETAARVPQWPGLLRKQVLSVADSATELRAPKAATAHDLGFVLDPYVDDLSYMTGGGLNLGLFTPKDAPYPRLLRDEAAYVRLMAVACRAAAELSEALWRPARAPRDMRLGLLRYVNAYDLEEAHETIVRALAKAWDRPRPRLLQDLGRGQCVAVPGPLAVFVHVLPELRQWLGRAPPPVHVENVTRELLQWLDLPHPAAAEFTWARPAGSRPSRGRFRAGGISWEAFAAGLHRTHPGRARTMARQYKDFAARKKVPATIRPLLRMASRHLKPSAASTPRGEPLTGGMLAALPRLPVATRLPSDAPEAEADIAAFRLAAPPAGAAATYTGVPPLSLWPDELPRTADDMRSAARRAEWSAAGTWLSTVRGDDETPPGVHLVEGATAEAVRAMLSAALSGVTGQALSSTTVLEAYVLVPLLLAALATPASTGVPADARPFAYVEAPPPSADAPADARAIWDAICDLEEATGEAQLNLRAAACVALGQGASAVLRAVLLAGQRVASPEGLRAGLFPAPEVLGPVMTGALPDGAEVASQALWGLRNLRALQGHPVLYRFHDTVLAQTRSRELDGLRVQDTARLLLLASENDHAFAALVRSHYGPPEEAMPELRSEEARRAVTTDALIQAARRAHSVRSVAVSMLAMTPDAKSARAIDKARLAMARQPDLRAAAAELVQLPQSLWAARTVLAGTLRFNGDLEEAVSTLRSLRRYDDESVFAPLAPGYTTPVVEVAAAAARPKSPRGSALGRLMRALNV